MQGFEDMLCVITSGLDNSQTQVASDIALTDGLQRGLVEERRARPDETSEPVRERTDFARDILMGKHFRQVTRNDIMASPAECAGENSLDCVKPQLHLHKGRGREVVPELVNKLQPDGVVTGIVARTGLPGFFIGNTAEVIRLQSDCALLAAKTPVQL